MAVGRSGILGMHFKAPVDIQRYNNSLVETDIQHIGFYSWQLGRCEKCGLAGNAVN